jgi:hypothetical protein
MNYTTYRGATLAQPSEEEPTVPIPKRPEYTIRASQVIGWILIVAVAITALSLAGGTGESATGLQWASVFSSAFGGFMLLVFAALPKMVSDISASSYATFEQLKSAKVKSNA